MAQNYIRQSTLSDGDTITASLFNDEYNQLVNAFTYSSTSASSTGHRHDGSSGQGGNIFKIGDLDFLNKIEVDSTNNRWGFYVEVSSAAVEQIRIQDGAIVPVTTNDIDLGTSSLQFKDLYIDGTANVDSLTLTSGATVTTILDEDDLSSDSATALVTQQSVKAYIDAQVTAQDFDFQADSGGALSIDLDSETMTFTGGAGITTTGLANDVTFAIDSTVATLTGTQTLTNKTLTSPDVNTPDIDGGTIDGTVIGGTTAAAGSFTTVSATGNITVDGTVDGRDVATDGTKLDGIEAGATADQTAAEIRTLVESATDSNVFTDADHTKLDGIEAGATGDQTNAEIRAAVEAATDSNVFTDADHSKLDGIEASADVTDTANVTAAGALMDSELTSEASVKALNQGVATTDSPTFAGVTVNGTVEFDGLSGTGAVSVTDILDQDDMSSNSATALATQQSIKAYVDSQVATADTLAEVLANGNTTGGTDVAVGTGDDITFADSSKAIFGAGSDLQIYHSGTTSFITENGIGDLRIGGNNLLLRSDDIFVQSEDGTANAARFNSTTGVTLYRAGAAKLATTSSGIDVTGTVTADGLTVDGQGKIQGAFALLDLVETDITDKNTRVITSGGQFRVDTVNDALSSSTKRIMVDHATGDISFYEDTGTTAKLFWDASAEALGIGTSSPSAAIHATTATAGYTAKFINTNGASDANGLLIQAGTVSSEYALNVANTAGTTNFMVVKGNGNVGIGTSSPSDFAANASNLVVGSGSGTEGITINSGTANYGVIYFADGTSGSAAYAGNINYNHADNSMRLGTNGSTTDVIIDSSGLVGIGTSSPAAGIHLTKSTSNNYLRMDDGSSCLINFSADTNSAVMTVQETGFSSWKPLELRANYLVFKPNNIERMRIDSSGNVGIGTSSIDNKVNIQESALSGRGASNSNTSLTLEHATDTGIQFFSATQTQLRFGDAASTAAGSIIYEHGEDKLRLNSGSLLTVATGGSERMRIDASGRVGIGITNPAYKLVVSNGGASGIEFGPAYSGTSNLIQHYNRSGAAYVDAVNIAAQHRFAIGGNEAMRINASGNVGIGTSSPSVALEVDGTIKASGNGKLQIADDTEGSTFEFNVGGGGALEIYDGAAERMRIDSSGNVLIGMTNDTPGLGDTDTGASFRADGASFVSRTLSDTSGSTFYVNRNTNDGNLIQFQKDGSTVGSIGTVSSEFYIAHDSTVDSGLRFRNGIIQPCNASGGSNPDAVSLGQISMRFSDLWLSGGAYLGGTASANKLDDYEEGTWTPEYEATTAFTSITYDSVTYGKYTKVGNLVHIQGIIRTDSISGGSGTVTLTGLPFTVGAAQFSSISLGYVNSFAGDSPGGMYVIGNGTSVSIRYRTTANGGLDNSLAVGDLDTGANKNYLAFGGTYITTA